MKIYERAKKIGAIAFLLVLFLANRWVAICVVLGLILIFHTVRKTLEGYLIDDALKREKIFLYTYLSIFIVLRIVRYFWVGEPFDLVAILLLFILPGAIIVGLHRIVLTFLYKNTKRL